MLLPAVAGNKQTTTGLLPATSRLQQGCYRQQADYNRAVTVNKQAVTGLLPAASRL